MRLLRVLTLVVVLVGPAERSLAQPTAAILPESATVQLVFISTPSEAITAADAAALTAQVERALAWWSRLVPTRLTRGDVQWAPAWPPAGGIEPAPPGTVRLYIVGDPGVEAWGMYGLRTVYIETGRAAQGRFESTVAHELGHAVFNLPDLYYWPELCPPQEPDIMCAAQIAYARGEVGCRSLRQLGLPCRVIHLPVVSR